MWLSVVLQALFFAIKHLPEIVGIIEALLRFFREHKNNPQMSQWMKEFSKVMAEAKETKDPKPIQEFLKRLQDSLNGGA